MSKDVPAVEPSVLTILHASREANCHYTYLAELARKGVIKSRRVGGRVLLLRDSFDAWNQKYQARKMSLPDNLTAAPSAVETPQHNSLSDEVSKRGKSYENSKSRALPATQS